MITLKRFLFLILLTFSLNLIDARELSHHVLVSIAPHRFFVEKIAKDTLTVGLIVPTGASAHTFEPTARQMLLASDADLWFCIGEGFENRAVKSFTAYNPDLKIIDLRKGLSLINADPFSGACCCHANSQDLHFWLSPNEAKVQAKTIAAALSDKYPKNGKIYEENLKAFLSELEDLDIQIEKLLKPLLKRTILVSHPAYAYFCRDYGLKQLSIEFEGKDPSPQQLTSILTQARSAAIDKVFIQTQYSSKGARLIAKEINAQIIVLDPYSENYIKTMLDIAKAFSGQS